MNKKQLEKKITQEGINAFLSGKGEKECPYPPSFPGPSEKPEHRTWWFNGWLNERSKKSCPNVFKRYPD